MNRPFQEKTKLLKFLQLENYRFDSRTASRISEKKSRETAYWGNLLLLDTVWGSHFPFINDIVIAVYAFFFFLQIFDYFLISRRIKKPCISLENYFSFNSYLSTEREKIPDIN